MIDIRVHDDLVCPRCGAPEVNEATGKLNIRGFKVTDELGRCWSICMTGKHGKRDTIRRHGYGFSKIVDGVTVHEHYEDVSEWWFCTPRPS